MKDIPFFLVDVFSEVPLGGNPLAVVPDADGLDERTMRKIAGEFNQSETTFLMRPTTREADWKLRSFTPTGDEVFGAGHNALGAWWWLAVSGQLQLQDDSTEFHQQIGTHILPLSIERRDGKVSLITMLHSAPVFGRKFENIIRIARALRLSESDFDLDRFPIQVVSTGANHMLVHVKTRDAVQRAQPDSEALLSILGEMEGQGCYLFTLETILSQSSAHARFFNPTVGIVEDPATGSAAGPLAAFLVDRGQIRDGMDVLIEQGFEVGRPSEIRVSICGNGVRIFGSAHVTASGLLHLGAELHQTD
jgi:trans-2,3-dihydro-3-hydroxyanthranilate isomerase